MSVLLCMNYNLLVIAMEEIPMHFLTKHFSIFPHFQCKMRSLVFHSNIHLEISKPLIFQYFILNYYIMLILEQCQRVPVFSRI